MPLVHGKAHSIYPHVFGYFKDAQRMVRTEGWKLIAYPKIDRYQLFDLRQDPSERQDLAHHPGRGE